MSWQNPLRWQFIAGPLLAPGAMAVLAPAAWHMLDAPASCRIPAGTACTAPAGYSAARDSRAPPAGIPARDIPREHWAPLTEIYLNLLAVSLS